ncbi:hypothetical protein SESBI_04699 [Sesbania bispinosa]|nr:hypothetical protein SESBI_04699 [Sesbania bispinosa]
MVVPQVVSGTVANGNQPPVAAKAGQPEGERISQQIPSRILGKKSVDNDLHGEWLLVSRNKKTPKQKAHSNALKMERGKRESSKSNHNRFADFKETTGTNVEIVNTNADYEKKGIKPNGKRLNQEAQPTSYDTQQPLARRRPVENMDIVSNNKSVNGPNALKQFNTGLKTMMNVEMVAPNHLRFVDEPKAPNPNDIGDPAAPDSISKHSEDMDGSDESDKDCDDLDMVEESPLSS